MLRLDELLANVSFCRVSVDGAQQVRSSRGGHLAALHAETLDDLLEQLDRRASRKCELLRVLLARDR